MERKPWRNLFIDTARELGTDVAAEALDLVTEFGRGRPQRVTFGRGIGSFVG
jgi:hypothetical protein